MTEEQAGTIISLLNLIHQELESISSSTGGIELYVMNLENKLDEIERQL